MHRHCHGYICPQIRHDTLRWWCIHPGCNAIGLTWLGKLLLCMSIVTIGLLGLLVVSALT